VTREDAMDAIWDAGRPSYTNSQWECCVDFAMWGCYFILRCRRTGYAGEAGAKIKQLVRTRERARQVSK